ncbi:NIPSNAP family protein [Microbacterium sp. GXF7504]
MTRTLQLRRYELVPGGGAEFVAWWAPRIPQVRAAHGFRVVSAVLHDAGDEFTWTVAYDGDEAAFRAAEERYVQDPRRIAAFEVAPPLRRQHLAFVTEVPFGAAGP